MFRFELAELSDLESGETSFSLSWDSSERETFSLGATGVASDFAGEGSAASAGLLFLKSMLRGCGLGEVERVNRLQVAAVQQHKYSDA